IRLATARVTLTPDEWRTFRDLKDSDSGLNRWLFGRIAAKDALRLLWHGRHGERVFPADIEAEETTPGRFGARHRSSSAPAEFPSAAVAHANGIAVGLAAFGVPVGVSVERLPAEAGGEGERSARLRCARQAVAQALGLTQSEAPARQESGSGIVIVGIPSG